MTTARRSVMAHSGGSRLGLCFGNLELSPPFRMNRDGVGRGWSDGSPTLGQCLRALSSAWERQGALTGRFFPTSTASTKLMTRSMSIHTFCSTCNMGAAKQSCAVAGGPGSSTASIFEKGGLIPDALRPSKPGGSGALQAGFRFAL
jgi:hypothetical protein